MSEIEKALPGTGAGWFLEALKPAKENRDEGQKACSVSKVVGWVDRLTLQPEAHRLLDRRVVEEGVHDGENVADGEGGGDKRNVTGVDFLAFLLEHFMIARGKTTHKCQLVKRALTCEYEQ